MTLVLGRKIAVVKIEASQAVFNKEKIASVTPWELKTHGYS